MAKTKTTRKDARTKSLPVDTRDWQPRAAAWPAQGSPSVDQENKEKDNHINRTKGGEQNNRHKDEATRGRRR